MSKKNTDKFKEWQKKNNDKNAGKILFNVQSKSPTVVKEKAAKEAVSKKKTTVEQMQDTAKQIRQTNDNLKKTETAKKAATAAIQNAVANKDITPKLTRPQKSNLQMAAELQKQAALRAQYGQYNNLWEKYALLNQAYGPDSHAQSAATWAKGLGHGAETGVNNLKSGYKQGLLAFAQDTVPYLAAQQNELMSVTPNKTARAALQANAEALSNLNLEQQRRANAQQAAQKQQAINQKYGDMKGGEKVISDVVSNAIPMAPAIAGGALSGGMMSTPLFFAYGRGMGEQSALNGGASMDKANVYGLASGALEAVTEALIGGIPGTKGLLDANSIVASRIGQQLFKNELAQKVGRAGIDIAGEGLEEILAGLADPYIQRQTWNPSAENATLKELLYQGALGSFTSGVFKGVNAAGNAMTNTMAGTAQDVISQTRQGQVENQWNAYIRQQQQLQEQQAAEAERIAEENEKAEKEAEQAKNEAMNAIIARNNLLNRPSNTQNVQNGAGQAINNQAINPITGNQNAPQNANTKAVSEQNTVKNLPKLEMADRTFENVGNRNVKAYQQENPAVKPYQQEVASRLLSDLRQGIKGGMDVGIDPETRNVTTRGSWQRQQSEPIEQMLQNGMTYQQIENGLNRIVEDHGKENVADAKRAELFVNDAVNKGYNSIVEGQVSYNPEAAYATMTVQDLLAERERLDNSFGEDEAFNQDLIRRMEAIDNLLYRKQTVPEQSALIAHPAKLQRASDINRQNAQQQSANKDITPKLQTAEAQQQAQQQVYEDTQAYADTQTQQQSVDDFAAYDRKRISSDVAAFLQQAEKKTGKKFDIRDGLPKNADGMCANGVIYLDGNRINSMETAHKLVVHEIYHAMRGTNEFGNLQDLVKKHLLSENQGSSMEQILQQKIAQYAKNGVQLDKDGAWDEVTAEFAGKALTDPNLAERVWREQPGLGQRIREKIQSMLDGFRNRKLSQAERNQKELLEKAADTFAKGMRSMQYQEDTQSESRYSIDMNLRRQFDRWLSGEMGTDDYFNLGRTPESLKKFGANDLQIVMTQDVLVKITGGKHSIALDEIAKLPEQIANPVMLFKGSVPNSFVVLTEIKDKSGNEAIAAVHLNRYQKRMRVNRVASLYGKNNIENYVQTNINQGNLLDVDTKKAPTWFTNRGLQLPKLVQTIINAKNNIPQNQQNINTQSDTRYSFSSEERDFSKHNDEIRYAFRDIPYEDKEQQNAIQQQTHQEMVDNGQVVIVQQDILDEIGQYYPDLRSMKKKDRIPILKAKMKELKTKLRQELNALKDVDFEFNIDGDTLVARLYDTGINEVLEKVTQPKAAMLSVSEDIFKNAEYMYSTNDYDNNPYIERWNYFYTPVQIGDSTVGARIAVRDMEKTKESQIYNWNIKKEASLDGARDHKNDKPSGISSDASHITIPQNQQNINEQSDTRYSFLEDSEALKAQQLESEGTDLSVGFDGYTEKEISNIESNRIKIARSKNDLSSFIEDAINNIGSPKVKMFIGKVGNELGNKIKQATQADVTGYNVSLSNHEAIKIMLNSHGNEQKEALRGQRAVKKDDLMMMADGVGNPDNIVYGGTNEHGKPVIRFEKSLGDLYVCVQTVSDKHHTLESKTMYIIKKSHSTGTDDIKSPVATFETNSGKALLNDHIILQNQEESNNKSDIRYSLNNPQQENIDKYGAIPPGENPYGNNRDIQVPQQTADDNKVGRFNRNAVESQQVNDQTVDAVMRDLRTYTPSSNQKQLNHANNVINSVGWAEAAQSFQTRYKAGEKMTANDIAIGERCIQEAQKAGNYQKAAELIGDVAALGVELGQAVQAMSMLKRLTPEGRLMALKRVQQRINADLQQKNKKKKSNDITPKLQTAEQEQQTQQESNQVTISPETEQRILEARGQQEMDDAWDAAIQEMADQLDATLMDKVRAWRYLGMLSNIRTHIRNIVSNGVKRGVIGIEHQIEAGLETAFVKEGGERYRTFKKVPKEYKEFAEWDFETNIRRQMEQTGSRYNDAVGQINRNKRIFESNGLETWRKTNENWLGGEDMCFKKDAYIDAFSNYLVANNLSPSVLQNNANATSTYEAAQNYAMEKAFEATFQEANKVATFLSQIEHSSKIGEVLIGALMPFKKTPLNILKQGTMVYSPVGLVKGLTNAMTKVKSGEMTQVEAIEQISRGLTGTGIAAVGALMMSLGMIALGGDDDKRKAKYDQQMGDQTYALKFRDGSTYSIDWLSPSVMPLLMGAEIYDSVKRAYNGELTDQSMMSAVTSSLMRIGDPLLEMSCMSGLADALSSYSDGGTEAMSNIIGTSIKNYAGQFIPAPVGALARTIDDTVRSSYASKDSAIGKGNEQFLRQQRSKIPGVSMQNEASIDVWGNERKREGSNIAGRAFNNFINPGNYSSNKRTALDNELEALYQSTGDSGIFPALASSTINESKQNPKISMTPEEYSRYSTIKGKKSQQYVSDFVNSEAYDQLDDSEKADIISSLYELANYEARKQTLDKRGYDYNLSDKEEVLESDVKPYEYYAAKKRFSGKWKTYKTVVKYAEHADRLGMDDDKYVEMNEALNGIKTDKKNGKTVSGSREKKVKEYLNRELNAGNITKEQWWYWYVMEYSSQAKNSPYAWQRTLHDDTESTTAQQQTDKGKANRSIQAVTTLQRPKR